MSAELATNYLGLDLVSPVVVGACPLTIEPETVRQLVGAGAGAIVLPSMLQEQIVHRLMKTDDPLGAIERSGYRPQQDKYNGGVDGYLQTIGLLKGTCPVPVIASLNGSSTGEWLEYAREIESAGADAIEFNLQQSHSDDSETSNQIESRLCQLISRVREMVRVPVAAKISQRYTNLSSMATQLSDAGASGLVLFTHQPYWDVCTDRMHWTIHWGLSPAGSLGGVLEGIVRARTGCHQLPIAASGGIATAEDAIKAMVAGASVVMVTSAIYRDGPDVIRNIVDGIKRHVEMSRHQTLKQFQQACPGDPGGDQRSVRLEYVDPMTRAGTYFDPTPVVSQRNGDPHGHQQ